jgi:hypothetical protein
MARTVHAVDVEIEGHLDPSLAKAVGLTEAQLKRLQAAQKTFNSLMSKSAAHAPREWQQAQERIAAGMRKLETASDRATRKMGEGFRHAAEQAHRAGEKIVKSFAGAFDRIAEKTLHLTGIGGILGTIGTAFAGEEFVRGAFETRAERGVLQNQLRLMTEARGKPGMAQEIDTMIRNFEGREGPQRYDQLMKATTLLLSSAPERFGNTQQVHRMLSQLADVSRDPEAFSMATQAFTRILAGGKVDQAHLRELLPDTTSKKRWLMR